MIRSICTLLQVFSSLFVLGMYAVNGNAEQATAEKTESAGPHKVIIAGGTLQLTAPAQWIVKQPRSRIVAHEFAIPAAEGDSTGGRLTIMGAGGSVQANIDRWLGQVTQPDGSNTKNKATITEKEIAGQKVSFVDLTGIYQDRPGGPFGPVVVRKDYRMLGAIIQTKANGNHFIKLYGPSKSIAGVEMQFHGFVESLQATQ